MYCVFIHVDTQLLKRNDISTLRFAEDRLISDPELQLAITSSLRKTLDFLARRMFWVEGCFSYRSLDPMADLGLLAQ